MATFGEENDQTKTQNTTRLENVSDDGMQFLIGYLNNSAPWYVESALNALDEYKYGRLGEIFFKNGAGR